MINQDAAIPDNTPMGTMDTCQGSEIRAFGFNPHYMMMVVCGPSVVSKERIFFACALLYKRPLFPAHPQIMDVMVSRGSKIPSILWKEIVLLTICFQIGILRITKESFLPTFVCK